MLAKISQTVDSYFCYFWGLSLWWQASLLVLRFPQDSRSMLKSWLNHPCWQAQVIPTAISNSDKQMTCARIRFWRPCLQQTKSIFLFCQGHCWRELVSFWILCAVFILWDSRECTVYVGESCNRWLMLDNTVLASYYLSLITVWERLVVLNSIPQ